MSRNKYIEFLAVAIGSIVASSLSPYLIVKFNQLGSLLECVIPEIFAVTFAAFGGYLIFRILNWAFQDLLFRLFWYRRLLEPRAKFEGQWIDEFDRDGKKYYAYIEIGFDLGIRDFMIQGHAYCEDGADLATFRNREGSFQYGNNTLRYFHEAQLWDGSKEYVQGCAELEFFPDKLRLNHGKGFFVDFGQRDRDRRTDVRIERITKKMFFKLLGKKRITKNEDYRTIITKYHSTREE